MPMLLQLNAKKKSPMGTLTVDHVISLCLDVKPAVFDNLLSVWFILGVGGTWGKDFSSPMLLVVACFPHCNLVFCDEVTD